SGKLMFSQNFNGCNVSRTAHIYLGNEAVAERTTRGHVEYMDLNQNGIDDCTDEKSGTNSAFNFDAPNLWQGLTQPEGPLIKLSRHQSHKQADAPLSAGMGWLFLLPFLANYLARGRRFFKQVFFACFMAASGNALAAVTEEITYLHTDLSGSVKAASDKNGNLLWRQEYTPSGAATLPTGQKIGFNNFQQDASGLVYMGARYYDPHIQRFLSPDPASQVTSVESNPMMVNRYAYANNNPVSYLDPDGNNPKLVLDFALNVGINMLVTGQPGFASAAVETAKGAFNPLATVSKVKKLAEAVRAANKVMAERAVVGKVAKDIPISRAKYGEAADHIADAQKAGHPDVLEIARDGASANRGASIGGLSKVPGKQLDEYPPAMFKEGGAGASVRAISPKDNMAAGACIGNACRGLANGEKVRIKVVP
ncbi:MAG TPA: RHS repeat-associated core domain-containing protein, partial [Cellvibrionaceae bacterium]|nr:RHS repeat-associated core domain-containing protein [Cellvibrionaceae bacterium]